MLQKQVVKEKGRLSLGGSMAGGIIKILAFIAGIIGAILFIVVVSVITYNVMDKGAQTQALQDASEIYHPPVITNMLMLSKCVAALPIA